jgi:lipopolysaccharide transport system ATP-binding protein
MYMRLAFAVAAHLEPDILLVDEVLAVGDVQFQRKCLGKMDEVAAKQGRTVLLVSHNMVAISAICRRAILLRTGSIAIDGNVTHAIGHYLSSLGSKEASFADLANWPTRYGAGEFARLMSVGMFDLKGTPCDVIEMKQGLVIRLHIHFLKAVSTPEVGVAISNLLGQRTTHLVSAWEGLLEPVGEGRYIYEITIPRLLLIPGPYALTVWVKREGRVSGGSDDGIEGALTFEVAPTAINGRVPHFDAYCQPGEVYMESRWTVGRA